MYPLKNGTTAKDDAYILKKSKQDPSKANVEVTNNLAVQKLR